MVTIERSVPLVIDEIFPALHLSVHLYSRNADRTVTGSIIDRTDLLISFTRVHVSLLSKQ